MRMNQIDDNIIQAIFGYGIDIVRTTKDPFNWNKTLFNSFHGSHYHIVTCHVGNSY